MEKMIERAREFIDAHGEFNGIRLATPELMAAFAEELLAERWIPIRGEKDLPKEDGEYWWTVRATGKVTRNGFMAISLYRKFAEVYSAYMRIEKPAPYTPTEEAEKDAKENV